jgi:hypothetical protein
MGLPFQERNALGPAAEALETGRQLGRDRWRSRPGRQGGRRARHATLSRDELLEIEVADVGGDLLAQEQPPCDMPDLAGGVARLGRELGSAAERLADLLERNVATALKWNPSPPARR